MIHINLLPVREILRRKKYKTEIFTYFSGFCVLILILVVIEIYQVNSISSLKEEEGKINEEKQKFSSILNDIKKIEEEKCSGNCKNIKLITMIKEGKPEDVILKTAQEKKVDEIIIGKSGKHGLERFFMGSTTERVVREANVPVNVIP